MYSLKRIAPNDSAGDVGSMCVALRVDEPTGHLEELPCIYPMLGYALKVGSPSARSYVGQDWWMTTPILEILEETEDDEALKVVFKTKNSTYEWRKLK